jgi:carbon-monoxide dehydrogenase medium subunit
VGVAVNLTRKDGQIADAKVTLVNVAPTPVRASGVEEVLRGAAIDDGLINRAAQRAGEGLEPSAELRASPEYKRHLAGVLTRRALRSALDGEAR